MHSMHCASSSISPIHASTQMVPNPYSHSTSIQVQLCSTSMEICVGNKYPSLKFWDLEHHLSFPKTKQYATIWSFTSLFTAWGQNLYDNPLVEFFKEAAPDWIHADGRGEFKAKWKAGFAEACDLIGAQICAHGQKGQLKGVHGNYPLEDLSCVWIVFQQGLTAYCLLAVSTHYFDWSGTQGDTPLLEVTHWNRLWCCMERNLWQPDCWHFEGIALSSFGGLNKIDKVIFAVWLGFWLSTPMRNTPWEFYWVNLVLQGQSDPKSKSKTMVSNMLQLLIVDIMSVFFQMTK